jgi:hypothetical protein
LVGTNFGNLTILNDHSLSDSLSSSSPTLKSDHTEALDVSQTGTVSKSSSVSSATATIASSSLADTTRHNLTSQIRQTSSTHVSRTTAPAKPTNKKTGAHVTENHTQSHLHANSTTGSCQSYCQYIGGRMSTLTWTPVCMATLAAHTVIHVVNNRTNTTQTITSSLDLSGIDDLGIVSLAGTPSRTQALHTTVTLSRGQNTPVVTVL